MDDATMLVSQVEKLYVLLQDGTRRALAPTGLTPTQVNLLSLLDDAPRSGISVSALADRMLCTRGNASRLIARLATIGLVTTGSTQTDERLLLVRLSPTGRTRLAAAREALAAADARWVSALSQQQLHEVIENLGALAAGLEAQLKRS